MSPAEPGRFFCTAGRGLEPFLAREVQARLGATEVDCVAGKVFFRAAAGPGELRKLRSGERLFLLLKKHGPLPVTRSRGKMLHEIKSFVTEEPEYWLDIISVWRKRHGHEGKTDDVSEEKSLALKRNSEETNTASKRQKTEQVRAIMSEECQAEAGETRVAPERMSGQECCIESKTSSEFPSKGSGENPTANEKLSFSFRVSCRCSGAIAKILTSQEIGKAIGIALAKQCGWRADLRDPDMEVVVLVCLLMLPESPLNLGAWDRVLSLLVFLPLNLPVNQLEALSKACVLPLCVCVFQSSGINTSLAAWACMGGEGSIQQVFQDPAPV